MKTNELIGGDHQSQTQERRSPIEEEFDALMKDVHRSEIYEPEYIDIVN